jgi:hypothetical protein
VVLVAPNTREARPVATNDQAGFASAADFDSFILSPLDDIARHVDGTLVVVLQITSGTYHRRCYLSAKSAQNAVRRAVDRGETATVYLAELKPLWKVREVVGRDLDKVRGRVL